MKAENLMIKFSRLDKKSSKIFTLENFRLAIRYRAWENIERAKLANLVNDAQYKIPGQHL